MENRAKLKLLHWVLFGEGKLEEARIVLRLLRHGIIHLGLNDDASWNVEMEIEKIGIHIRYSRNYNYAIVEV